MSMLWDSATTGLVGGFTAPSDMIADIVVVRYSEIQSEFDKVRESSQVADRWPRAGFYIYSGADVNHSVTQMIR